MSSNPSPALAALLSFIFPGLGLAAIAANARKITDSMTKVASEALAAQVTAEERSAGLLFPSVSRLRAVSFEIAVAVARQAVKDGVADTSLAEDQGEVLETYAAQAIPIYWIVNLRQRRIEVYTDPTGPAGPPFYRSVHHYAADDDVPVVLDGREVGRFLARDVLS